MIPTEWTLHSRVLQAVFRIWGTPMVDSFATALNRRLPVYCSPVPDPLAWHDAFTVPWDHLDAYAFPPCAILRLVINRVLMSSHLRLILIAPMWPQQEWYPDLLALLVEEPIELPLWRNLLRQLHTQAVHGALVRLRLHPWRLSSVPSERERERERDSLFTAHNRFSHLPSQGETPLTLSY